MRYVEEAFFIASGVQLDTTFNLKRLPTNPAQRANFRGGLGSVKDIHHLTSHGQLELNCQLKLLRPRCLIYFRENHTSIIQLMHSLFRVAGSEPYRSVGRDQTCSPARLHN